MGHTTLWDASQARPGRLPDGSTSAIEPTRTDVATRTGVVTEIDHCLFFLKSYLRLRSSVMNKGPLTRLTEGIITRVNHTRSKPRINEGSTIAMVRGSMIIERKLPRIFNGLSRKPRELSTSLVHCYETFFVGFVRVAPDQRAFSGHDGSHPPH